jgi:alkanesulfonate monooxygenase SsuD/methylene tetrahydromethanopterin reductase-like flavin-dependent oxidoreductase (luciferase family)
MKLGPAVKVAAVCFIVVSAMAAVTSSVSLGVAVASGIVAAAGSAGGWLLLDAARRR